MKDWVVMVVVGKVEGLFNSLGVVITTRPASQLLAGHWIIVVQCMHHTTRSLAS